MKVLWLCNMVPGCVQEALGGKSGGGLWTDHVLSDLQAQGIGFSAPGVIPRRES